MDDVEEDEEDNAQYDSLADAMDEHLHADNHETSDSGNLLPI